MRGGGVKKLAVCAMLSALGVVLLTVGRFFSVLDLSMAVIASLACVIAVTEYGGAYPWLVFSVTSVLSVVLAPDNTAAWMYLLFFGFYPILKTVFEKLSKLASWMLKELVFNVSLAAVTLIMRFLLIPTADAEPWIMYVVYAILAEAVFVLYDIALTRVIRFYKIKLRDKLNLK